MSLIDKQLKRQFWHILIGGLIGYLFQILAREYLNSEKSNTNEANPSVSKPKTTNFLSKIPRIGKIRGGIILTASIPFIIEVVVNGSAIIGMVGGYLKESRSSGNLAQLFYNNSPQNFPIEPALIPVEEVQSEIKKIDWLCDPSLNYLFKILTADSFPFEKKVKVMSQILYNEVNLKTDVARVNFVLCMIEQMVALYTLEVGSYESLSVKLAEVVRKGIISPTLVYAIVRKVGNKGRKRIHPDLIAVLNIERGGSTDSLERESFFRSSELDQKSKAKTSLRTIVHRWRGKGSQMVRTPFKNMFLPSLVFAFLLMDTISGSGTTKRPRDLVQDYSFKEPEKQMQRVQTTSWVEDISEFSEEENTPPRRVVQVGDKLLIVSSSPEKNLEEPVETIEKEINTFDRGQTKIKGRPKKAPKRGAKVVRFSDLPPLPDSDFTEIIQEPKFGSKIRVKTESTKQ